MTPHLYEVRNVRQHDNELPRRWFTSEYADLYTWGNHKIKAFEFCYNKLRNEHVLCWKDRAGFTHARIDDGEHNILRKGTPIIATDGTFDSQSIIFQFESTARLIDPRVYRFILSRLYEIV